MRREGRGSAAAQRRQPELAHRLGTSYSRCHLMSFRDLGLSEEVLQGVQSMGYVDPTPIQLRSFPVVLSGRDLIASAQTGTGKTAAFILPILQKLGAPPARAPRALVLTQIGRAHV